jgi:hypothetical protein
MMVVMHRILLDSGSMPLGHPTMHVPGGMGWAMVLGPVAMALWLGGIVSLVVAFVRWVAEGHDLGRSPQAGTDRKP